MSFIGFTNIKQVSSSYCIVEIQGGKLYYRDQYQFVTNYTTSKTWISSIETIFQENDYDAVKLMVFLQCVLVVLQLKYPLF